MTSKVYAARRQEIDEEDIPVEEQVERMRARLAMNYSYVILPNHKYLQRWDLVTMLALIFTALVTPVEVGFTSKALWISDPLFIVNRCVDLVFVCDLVLQFNLSYRDELKGGQLIKSRKAIARRYLRGWFSVDFVSVIPFELLPVPPSFKMMRLIRLLRLLKLARVLKASRMLARYETVIDLTYAQRDMVKFSIMIIVMAHWLACLWGLVDTMARGPRDTDTMTWVTYALKSWDHEADTEGNFDTSYSFDIASVHDRYVVSLYFVMYMLTSIGFGDISATTMPEYYVCTLMMVVSAIFWAYVVGNFCSIMSTADVFGIEFKQRMDELNYMMNERHFDAELKKRCRMFYIESKQTKRVLNYRKLETEMSLQMRGEVAMANNKAWMCKLWYFESASDPFVVELSPRVLPLVFAPTEKLNLPRTLYVLCRGITARKGMPLSKGSVWGLDFVLDDATLADSVAASALTYTEVLTLSYGDLHAVLENENYELERAFVRKASVFYSIKARLRMKAKELRGFSDDPDQAESNGGKTGVGMLGGGATATSDGPPAPSTSFARLVKNEPQGGLLPPLKDGALSVGDVGAASQDITTIKIMIARIAEQQRTDKSSLDQKLQSIIAHLHAVHGMRGAQGH